MRLKLTILFLVVAFLLSCGNDGTGKSDGDDTRPGSDSAIIEIADSSSDDGESGSDIDTHDTEGKNGEDNTLAEQDADVKSDGDITWQEVLEQHFDIVETFDQLQDWTGQNVNGQDRVRENLPKKQDGSDSIWDFYDYWTTEQTISENWIGFHSAENVWRGRGKSLLMDIDNTYSKKGPARFGFYFGTPDGGTPNAYSREGSPDSGYDEVYYFYMLKFPHDEFPKDENGAYKYFDYQKLNVLASGFRSVSDPVSDSKAYGPSNTHPVISFCSNYCGENAMNNITVKLNYFKFPEGEIVHDSFWPTDGGLNEFIANEEWFGLEFYTKRGTPGVADGQIKIWLYDKDGNVDEILNVEEFMTMVESWNYKYNKFFFGGNLSYHSEVEAQNLDTSYFVDDFIMDDARIGPKYFSLYRQ